MLMFYKTLAQGFLSVMKVGELYSKGIMECTDPTVLGFGIMNLCQFVIIVFLSDMSCVGSTCVVLSLKESGRFS